MKKLIVTLIVLAAAGGGAGFYYTHRPPKEPEVRTSQVTSGDIVQSVQATGTLEAVTTVEVGTQVGGIIQELYADFNSIVKKGQVIARLDPTILDTQIEQQKANVTRSEADLDRLRVSLADAKQKLERAKTLSDKNLLPRTELETAQVNVNSTEAQIKSSEASLEQAKSQLNTAVVNREHTVITAPIDGIVIARKVEPGQTVNAGMSAPTLFILAGDLTKMQVNANIDEADVGNIRSGQNVTFRVDAFSGQMFSGTVQQVRLQPTTVQNVVTYQTIILVPNPDYKLKPGMTASPLNIEITRKSNVLRIPTAATRFRPTTEMFAALKQDVPPDFGRGAGGGRNAGNRGGGGPGGPGGKGGFGGSGGGAPGAAPGGAPAPAANASAEKQTPAEQANAAPKGERQPRPGVGEAKGGGDRMGGNRANNGGDGGSGRGFGGGGRGFDPNMTPEERLKRMQERMASMTPEERQAYQERMAARGQGGRGGQGGNPDQGGRGGFGGGQNPRQNATNQNAGTSGVNSQNPMRGGAPMGRVANVPSMTGGATTVDSLFGPLPIVETRGSAWLYQDKKLKQVRLRLGVSDANWTEVIEGEGLKEGTEVVTNVIIETPQTAPGANNANNPLMGPQRGRGGPGGGPGGGGGGRGGGRG